MRPTLPGVRITLVRHGRTADNHGRIWQGWGGSGLDDEGRSQAAALAARLDGRVYDRVISSDIQRVVETAAHLDKAVELSTAWREIHVGSWAGRSIPETYEQHTDDFDAMRRGESVRIGGDGETTDEFHARVVDAFFTLVDQHDEGDDVLVLAHGGVIGTLVAELFGTSWPASPTAPITNTSLTTLEVGSDRQPRLTVLNDAAHLGHLPGFAGVAAQDGGRVVTVVRHGVTDANLGDIWHGHACGGLNEAGRDQARRLAAHLGRQPRLWSSDTPRAAETAAELGDPILTDGLREISFGSWEGLGRREVEARDPDLARRIYVDREDLPRGGDGESWQDLTERVAGTVDAVLAETEGDVTFVSHGSAIRSYLLRSLDVGWEASPRLGLLPNTGFARLIESPWGMRLFDYGLAPHLERQPALRK